MISQLFNNSTLCYPFYFHLALRPPLFVSTEKVFPCFVAIFPLFSLRQGGSHEGKSFLNHGFFIVSFPLEKKDGNGGNFQNKTRVSNSDENRSTTNHPWPIQQTEKREKNIPLFKRKMFCFFSTSL
jgi:hypothetical protein